MVLTQNNPQKVDAKPDGESKERTILSWNAPEFLKASKGLAWFMVAGLAVAGLVFYAIQTSSFTMALAFIVLAGVYAISHHRSPQNIEYQVTNLGLKAGNRRIPYNQIKAFWIVYHPPKVKILKILTTDNLLAEVTFQLGDQDPGEVRDQLLRQLPEYEGRGENFIDALIRVMKL